MRVFAAKLIGAALFTVGCTPGADRSIASSAPIAPREMARAFAMQADMCGARVDTGHPAFHGCVDWHSAVHSAWALSAYARWTGDFSFEADLSKRLSASAIAEEFAFVRAHPAFEMPYGRAWFLRLAIARPDDAGIQAMAGDIAISLKQYYSDFPPDPYSAKYDSASWALLNLLEYARAKRDDDLRAFVVSRVRAEFLGKPCSLDLERHGFIAVCVTWAWLVSEALPEAEFRAWFARWNPGVENLEPLSTFESAHDYGLNFSRAWGLGRLALRLDSPDLQRAYIQHLQAGFAPAERWRGDYMETGHWVAQFGMLAIEPMLATPSP